MEVPDDRRGGAGLSETAIEPDELAAILFTSGSTGEPKGVMQTHRTLLHTALRHANGLGIRASDRVALVASPAGGQGMGTTWTTLLSGASPLSVPDHGTRYRRPPGLAAREPDHGFLRLASVFRHLVRTLDGESFPDLRLVRMGSEQVRREDFDAFRRHFGESSRFANVFSLTEAGGISHQVLAAEDDPPNGGVPAGRPAANVEIQLRDERGRPVAEGDTGEIFVRSRYLSPATGGTRLSRPSASPITATARARFGPGTWAGSTPMAACCWSVAVTTR